jgi:hypothetical protein
VHGLEGEVEEERSVWLVRGVGVDARDRAGRKELSGVHVRVAEQSHKVARIRKVQVDRREVEAARPARAGVVPILGVARVVSERRVEAATLRRVARLVEAEVPATRRRTRLRRKARTPLAHATGE